MEQLHVYHFGELLLVSIFSTVMNHDLKDNFHLLFGNGFNCYSDIFNASDFHFNAIFYFITFQVQ